MLGESVEFRKLRHAVEKAAGDRNRAIRNVCRLYGVKTLDALPPGSRATALALLGPHVSEAPSQLKIFRRSFSIPPAV